MRLIVIFVFLFTFSNVNNAQESSEISIGKNVTIFSKILKENRKIWVYTPDKTSKANVDDKEYPVLYLLDCEAQFYSTVGLIQQLSQANLNSVLPEMIVVGVENKDRFKDLTPVLNSTNSFTNFIEQELIPYVNNNYKASNYKLLVGHSLGGLLAMDVLGKKPDLFNAFIVIDPSMWYNNEMFLNEVSLNVKNSAKTNQKLFMGVANTLPKGVLIADLDKDKSFETQHIRSIFKLDQNLKQNSKIKYAQKYYEKESHISVPLITQYDGLRFIFDYYLIDATEKEFIDSSPIIVSKLRNHYTKVSNELGYKVCPPESFINYIAFDALTKKQYEKAEGLYKLNIENYPISSKVYEAYADFLLAIENNSEAIKMYKKALSIKEDDSIKNKLKNILNPTTYSLSVNELQKYQGEYIIEDYNLSVLLVVEEGKLIGKMSGQPSSEFVPISKDLFTIKSKQGYSVFFERKDNKIVSFTSTHLMEFLRQTL